ncbi:elongation factor 1-delta-like [Senna tora]|uniref:Elongation factor 1-delta-like n=1 Tax=Senna tora TaxID=362788 RepID=A0A834X420_9FABA|nr:elongation factor 1-delta-like [Senna tora]
MAVAFHDVNSASGLKKLDDYLLSRSYITGYQASKDDVTVYAALSKAPSAEYVNVSRCGVSGEGSGVTVEGSVPITEETVATPPPADTKAFAFLSSFGFLYLCCLIILQLETEEEKKAAEERAAAVKASTKKKESGKSSVLLDVKPWDDETDMKKLEEAVRSVQMEGLLWGASKLVPVGYGIKKMQIMLTIVDDLVSVDTLIEERLTCEPINEYVQSCDIVAFNKICKYFEVFVYF